MGIGSAGVTLAFGTRATGIDRISDSLKRLARAEAGNPFAYEPLPVLPMGRAAESEVTALRRLAGSHDHLVVTVDLHGGPEALADQVGVAVRLCTAATAKRLRLRVILLVGGETLGEWLQIPAEIRGALEGSAGAVVLECWDSIALQQALLEQEIPHTPEALQRALTVTGGFHLLVEELFRRCRRPGTRNLASVMEDLADQLGNPRSDLARSFGDAAAVGGPALALFQSVCELLKPGESAPRDVVMDLPFSPGPAPGASDARTGRGTHRTPQSIDDLLVHLERLGLMRVEDGATTPVAAARTLLGAG